MACGKPLISTAREAYFLPKWDGDALEKLYICGKFGGAVEIAAVPADDAFLRAFLSSKAIKKYTAGVKRLHRAALRLGKCLESTAMDTELAAYLLNPSGSDYTVQRLAAEYGVPTAEYEDETAGAAAALAGVCAALQRAIDENGQHELLETIELPLALVLGEMEESPITDEMNRD